MRGPVPAAARSRRIRSRGGTRAAQPEPANGRRGGGDSGRDQAEDRATRSRPPLKRARGGIAMIPLGRPAPLDTPASAHEAASRAAEMRSTPVMQPAGGARGRLSYFAHPSWAAAAAKFRAPMGLA